MICADDSPATETLRLALSQSAWPEGLRLVLIGQPVVTLAALLARTPVQTALPTLIASAEAALTDRRADRANTHLLIAQEALAHPQALAALLGLGIQPVPQPLPLPAPALPDALLILLARHLIDRDPALGALEQALMAERSALAPVAPTDPLDLETMRGHAADNAAARRRDADTIALLEARCASGREELEAMARQNIALVARIEEAEAEARAKIQEKDAIIARARARADQAIRDRDAARAELDRFYRSNSYRVTAPLRWLRRRLRP